MIRSCKNAKHDPRRIASGVVWCARCGSIRRVVLDDEHKNGGASAGARGHTAVSERWSKWIPCGVERLKPRKQLELSEAELVALVEDIQTQAAAARSVATQLQLEITDAANGGKAPTLRIVRD